MNAVHAVSPAPGDDARGIASGLGGIATDGCGDEVLAGLRGSPRQIPCKYLYDAQGSALFEAICDLPEYYLTRSEIALLGEHAAEFAELIGPDAELVEFGAGAGIKVRLLLDALSRPQAYLPIDISASSLLDAARRIAKSYPEVAVRPLAVDYTRAFRLPAPVRGARRRIGFFPGSTIGNFTPNEALVFLRRLAVELRGGGLLIGVDLIKDPAELHAAYNDAEGITAAFNRNLLFRANRELGADFAPERFAHYAFYHPQARRIEMHLVSLDDQRVTVAGEAFTFAAGEAVHTEDSYKYTVADFCALAAKAGFVPRASRVDSAGRFSLHWLEAPG